jgi:nicotinamidase-related amidase
MPIRNPDLHGSVPEESPVALLLIDTINTLDFEGGGALLKPALAMANRIARLKHRAREAHIPAIYVNDNFGRWNSDFRSIVDHCLDDRVPGRALVEKLIPAADDYVVLKSKHSGFFGTPLNVVLRYVRANTLIVSGLTTDICVLFTAMDAYLRDYRLIVPADCVASANPQHHREALEYMRRVLDADTRRSSRLDLRALMKKDGTRRRSRRE